MRQIALVPRLETACGRDTNEAPAAAGGHGRRPGRGCGFAPEPSAIATGSEPGRRTASASARHLLLIAVCAGPRCRGLRNLHDPSATTSGPCGQILCEAVRRRPGSVLISTGCLGPCQRACVAAVGWAVGDSGQLRWSGRPVGLGMVEMPLRAAALAAWISGSAPDLTTLPEPLWRVGAT